MSSRVATRAVCAGLGLLFLAGSARAGEPFTTFPECAFPTLIPGLVYNTILDDASFGFGDLSEKVCNGIVNKGVSICKSQVKLAAKCNDRAVDALYNIVLKQCAQLTTSLERENCKQGTKANRSAIKADNKTNKDLGIAICEGKLAGALENDCLTGLVPAAE